MNSFSRKKFLYTAGVSAGSTILFKASDTRTPSRIGQRRNHPLVKGGLSIFTIKTTPTVYYRAFAYLGV